MVSKWLLQLQPLVCVPVRKKNEAFILVQKGSLPLPDVLLARMTVNGYPYLQQDLGNKLF